MILPVVQIVVALLLVLCILLQMQGSGIGGAFGGTSQVYRSKRSVEKVLVTVTIVLTVLFATLSLLLLIP